MRFFYDTFEAAVDEDLHPSSRTFSSCLYAIQAGNMMTTLDWIILYFAFVCA